MSRLTTPRRYRGRVEATEYLGTTQIVTLATAARRRSRPASPPADRSRGGRDGRASTFDARTLSLFDAGTGRALRTAANEGVLHHG